MDFAIRGEIITFDGSATYVSGVKEADRQANLEYRWTCTPPLHRYCDGMNATDYLTADGEPRYGENDCARLADLSNPIISFSDSVFEACGAEFCEQTDPETTCEAQSKEYEVKLSITYTGEGVAFGEKDATGVFAFFDVAAPTFQIGDYSTPLVSATTE